MWKEFVEIIKTQTSETTLDAELNQNNPVVSGASSYFVLRFERSEAIERLERHFFFTEPVMSPVF